MKTKPFPFYRYNAVMDEGPGPFLAWSAKNVGSETFHKVAETMYPGMDPQRRMEAIIGGAMEFVQAYLVSRNGVVLHVADHGLIDACRNSEIPENLTLKDFMLPYPFIEVRFPKDTNLQPAFLVNTFHSDYREWANAYRAMLGIVLNGEVDFRAYREMEEGWILATAEKEDAANEHIRSLMVDAAEPLWGQMLHSERSIATDAELGETRDAIKVLLLSLLMRREETPVRAKRAITGIKAKTAKQIEKRPQYTVTPPKLISQREAADRYEGGHSGREVTGHWRQAHLRVLSHPRYKRKTDGTPKVLFIAPVAVKGGGKGERTV